MLQLERSLGLCRFGRMQGRLLVIWCDELSPTKVVVVVVMLF